MIFLDIELPSGFQSFLELNYAQTTIDTTRRHLKHAVAEGVDLDNRDSFRTWVQARRRQGALDKTLNVYIKAFNRYLKYQGKTEIKKYREQEGLVPRRATMEDYEKLIAACKGATEERMILVLNLLFKTGVRLGELHQLTLDSINQDIATVIGKGQKKGTLWISDSVRGALSRWLRVRKDKHSSRKLFTSVFGEPLTYDGLRGDIFQLARRAGVHFSPHMARRFYARWLYSQGFDLEQIRIAMRHKSLDVTKRYMQIDVDDNLAAFRAKKPDFFLGGVEA